VAPLKGRKGNCPCCAKRSFEWLDGAHGTQTTTLCGRNAVQVSHRASNGKLDFDYLAGVLKQSGAVSFNKFLLKFQLTENGDPYEFTVFPDGRAIIKGTSEPDKARTLYAKYVGH
jgi:adenylyltransferase/sulfurtransferase